MSQSKRWASPICGRKSTLSNRRHQSLVLDPERIAHIQVTDAAEKPIAGASVECVDQQAHDYRHLITDERGAVVVRGLRISRRRSWLFDSHERYVSSTDFDRTINLPADAEVSTHGLIMQAAGVVVGVITDAGTHQPLNGAACPRAGCSVTVSPAEFSDFEGAYRMTGVTPGKTPITVHLGYAPQLIEPQVVAGEEVTLNFALGPARVITGQVVDGEQKPMAAVHVRTTRWAGNDTLGLQAMTDEAGRFVIANAPRDAFEISLYARGFKKPLLDQTIKPEQEKFAFALAADPAEHPGMEGAGPTVGSTALSVTTLDGRKVAGGPGGQDRAAGFLGDLVRSVRGRNSQSGRGARGLRQARRFRHAQHQH